MKSRRKIIPRVRCDMPETAVCDVETGGCRSVGSADDRVDQQGCTVIRLLRYGGKDDWRSLYAAEITLYSVRSWTLSQRRYMRIWSGLEDLGAATTARVGDSGCAEDYLTGILGEISTWKCSNKVWNVHMK